MLPDGSYRGGVRPRRGRDKQGRAVPVRVIGYAWADAKGHRHTARLVTSPLEAARHPAAELVELYHRRWDVELASGEVNGQLAGRPMRIRAREPPRVCQEVAALRLGRFALRRVMVQAARQAGVPPVALSLTGGVRVLQVRLARLPRRPARGARAWRRWGGSCWRPPGPQALRPRRPRRCPRARKVTRGHWPLPQGQAEETIPQREIVPPAAPAENSLMGIGREPAAHLECYSHVAALVRDCPVP